MTLDDDQMTSAEFVAACHHREQAAAHAEWQEQQHLESEACAEACWARTMALPKPAYLCSDPVERPWLDRRCHPLDGDVDRPEL